MILCWLIFYNVKLPETDMFLPSPKTADGSKETIRFLRAELKQPALREIRPKFNPKRSLDLLIETNNESFFLSFIRQLTLASQL